MAVAFSISKEEQDLLSRVVLDVISDRLESKEVHAPKLEEFPENLRQRLGCFVTLNIRHRLRGCIGTIVGMEPLVTSAWKMAQASAFNDHRFPRLTASEWPNVSVEITVLDKLTPCPGTDRIEIGKHGLVLQFAGRTGVFLPQVPVEQHWDVPAYLSNLCRKAGVPDGSWKEPKARLFWYEGFKFTAREV